MNVVFQIHKCRKYCVRFTDSIANDIVADIDQ